jgi:hypothetical protein
MPVTGTSEQTSPHDRAKSELRKFSKIWRGGYLEGNPLDRMTKSSYGRYGYNSVLYTVYLTCIKPFIKADTAVLEIGPGRGAWTKAILERNPKSVVVVDAAPSEHTGFWEYVGHDPRVTYCVVSDFTLSDVAPDSIDYFFSYGVFCHIPPDLSAEYIYNLFAKMRKGAHGFLMIADHDKYNRAAAQPREISLRRALIGGMRPLRMMYDVMDKLLPQKNLKPIREGLGTMYPPLLFHHFAVDDACDVLRRAGFAIVEADMEVNSRDPMIHFVKE